MSKQWWEDSFNVAALFGLGACFFSNLLTGNAITKAELDRENIILQHQLVEERKKLEEKRKAEEKKKKELEEQKQLEQKKWQERRNRLSTDPAFYLIFSNYIRNKIGKEVYDSILMEIVDDYYKFGADTLLDNIKTKVEELKVDEQVYKLMLSLFLINEKEFDFDKMDDDFMNNLLPHSIITKLIKL